jgi:hypothetical protein
MPPALAMGAELGVAKGMKAAATIANTANAIFFMDAVVVRPAKSGGGSLKTNSSRYGSSDRDASACHPSGA